MYIHLTLFINRKVNCFDFCLLFRFLSGYIVNYSKEDTKQINTQVKVNEYKLSCIYMLSH